MNFKKFFFRKTLNRRTQNQDAPLNINEEDFADLIRNPEKISSKMVRKIVLNGLTRLEKEGYDPFSGEISSQNNLKNQEIIKFTNLGKFTCTKR